MGRRVYLTNKELDFLSRFFFKVSENIGSTGEDWLYDMIEYDNTHNQVYGTITKKIG